MTLVQTPWQKLLAGDNALKALRDTEVAEFYWTTDIKTPEISAAFCDGVHVNKVASLAGPASFVGCSCERCSKPIYAFSRQDAVERVDALSKDWTGMANWANPKICHECKHVLYQDRFKHDEEQAEKRRQRVRELRFMPYRDYLQTPEWQSTRESALRRAKYRCQTCSDDSQLHVHHRTYVRRGAEWTSDLIVLCADCHSLFHSKAKLADGGRAA